MNLNSELKKFCAFLKTSLNLSRFSAPTKMPGGNAVVAG